jgi:hypothetical protein
MIGPEKRLRELLLQAKSHSIWAHWIANDDGQSAEQYRVMLDSAFRNILAPKQKDVAQRLIAGNQQQTDATIQELLVHECPSTSQVSAA